MTKEMFMDLLRTGMKVLGGLVLAKVAKYGVTQASWDTLTAGSLILGALAWSWWSTFKFTVKQ
jgi:hypothetical protein